MIRNSGPIEDVKKQYVRMALESGNTSFLARKLGISPKTFGNWVRKYRDEVEEEMTKEGIQPLNDSSKANDLQSKYDQAMKLLGEKELEVAMLRELFKKNSPDFPKR
jgi:transposase